MRETGRKQNNIFFISIEIKSKICTGSLLYGLDYLCWVQDKFAEAEQHGLLAIKIEPLNAICYGSQSLILHAATKFNDALTMAKTGIEIDASSFLCHLCEGNSYSGLHQYQEAVSSYENALRLSNRHQFPAHAMLWAYCKMKDFKNANIIMDELKERALNEYISCTLMDLSSAYLNNIDEAFIYLNQAYDNYESFLISIKYEPWVPAILKSDPRYHALLNKIEYP